jgi:vacuolar-type H+-ATPase subunit H
MNANRSTTSPPVALLEAIRQAETEAGRRLAAEREAIAVRLAEARREAEARLAAAEHDGRLEGERRRQAAHCQAEHEAAEMIARAQQQAAVLRLAGRAAQPGAVALALAFILENDHAS